MPLDDLDFLWVPAEHSYSDTLEALRERYRQERDKRPRPDGNDQYREVKDEFGHFVEDPYVAPIEREPVTDDTEVTIIGGGHGGLLIAARLRKAGVEDIRIVDAAGDFGGTWYWNRYPGAMCDTESYIYMPLLEETGYVPSEKYAKAPEILAHCQRIGKHFDLYRQALFQTQIRELRWDESCAMWRVSTNRGDAFRTRFVCMANGNLARPKLPGVPGIETFKGHMFHTSRWDYDYTGGDSKGNLVKLGDKKVAIIGTGATAVQCVPHVGESARHLYVFQRTPSSVDVRGNRRTDPDWAKSLSAGWQKARQENFSILTGGGTADEDLVNDGWTEIASRLPRGSSRSAEEAALLLEIADFEKMEQIRRRAESIVTDKVTADALKPWYRQFCKRPCFHDEYLQTYNRPNVTLVDTDGRGVERITEKGVVANGVEYEVDCIIFASGFEVGTPLERRAGFNVYGREGVALSEKWADGIKTFYGVQTHGFPNCFVVLRSQAGASFNVTHSLDVQSEQIAFVIDHARRHEASSVDVTEDAEAGWVKTCLDAGFFSVEFLASCTPGYYNNEGQPDGRLVRQNGPYGRGIMEYQERLREWRAGPDLPGLVLTYD